jgi:starch synthase (maltosyl-transferring)
MSAARQTRPQRAAPVRADHSGRAAAAPVDASAPVIQPPARLARRVIIDRLRPEVDGGRFAIKRTTGEEVEVVADIFADGHDVIRAVACDRHVGRAKPQHPEMGSDPFSPAASEKGSDPISGGWHETPMQLVAPGSDQWAATFRVSALGWHEYAVVAWLDRFSSWRRDFEIKATAGQEVSSELAEGALLLRGAAERARQSGDGGGDAAEWLLARADALDQQSEGATRIPLALDPELAAVVDRFPDRSRATMSPPRRVFVDRERARFGAWYEMFPRSAGSDPRRSGTWTDAAALLPRIALLGFDVVYLPPIHPIGTSFRKGPNNRLTANPGDPGSPWAIGSPEGGHDAIEPGLGTLDEFIAFRQEAERLDLEIAIDLAWQCSPDHPWVTEHPEWFRHRPDGTIKYADNPPKKYQDIYPIDFDSADWQRLWNELLRVTLLWVERGIEIFRVDNPHTKTFGFWEWLIDRVHAVNPRVIFLAEAFTRPRPMRYLAKAGFTQSYTYFTWRNTRAELTEYLTELTTTDVREYFRPNFFANTPDILHAYLQHGGRPAFEARLLLAATLAATYGIYSGFELCEGRAVPGTEEYADSEKYQLRTWDWDRPGNIADLVARVNRIRREHPALHSDWTLRFHATDNPQIIAYSKSAPADADTLLMIVNLDPHHMHHGYVQVPIHRLGLGVDDFYTAHDLIDGSTYGWRGEWNYVRLDPGVRQGHILRLER